MIDNRMFSKGSPGQLLRTRTHFYVLLSHYRSVRKGKTKKLRYLVYPIRSYFSLRSWNYKLPGPASLLYMDTQAIGKAINSIVLLSFFLFTLARLKKLCRRDVLFLIRHSYIFKHFLDPVSRFQGLKVLCRVDMIKLRCSIEKELSNVARREKRSLLHLTTNNGNNLLKN